MGKAALNNNITEVLNLPRSTCFLLCPLELIFSHMFCQTPSKPTGRKEQAPSRTKQKAVGERAWWHKCFYDQLCSCVCCMIFAQGCRGCWRLILMKAGGLLLPFPCICIVSHAPMLFST